MAPFGNSGTILQVKITSVVVDPDKALPDSNEGNNTWNAQ